MHRNIVLRILHRQLHQQRSRDVVAEDTMPTMPLTRSEKRGVCFLSACVLTCLIMACMMDGFVTAEYGLAFIPIYIFWCAVVLEQIMAVPRYQLVIAENDMHATSYRFGPRWWGGILNACLWLVVFVLLELYLYGVSTVPAVSFVYLFVLWACLSILSAFWKNEFVKPFSLYSTANYVCNVHEGEPADYGSYLDDRKTDQDTSSGFGEIGDNNEDDDTLFHEQAGTVRRMSVNESVRNSINGSPRHTDDEIEVLVNELEELEERRAADTVESVASPADKVSGSSYPPPSM